MFKLFYYNRRYRTKTIALLSFNLNDNYETSKHSIFSRELFYKKASNMQNQKSYTKESELLFFLCFESILETFRLNSPSPSSSELEII